MYGSQPVGAKGGKGGKGKPSDRGGSRPSHGGGYGGPSTGGKGPSSAPGPSSSRHDAPRPSDRGGYPGDRGGFSSRGGPSGGSDRPPIGERGSDRGRGGDRPSHAGSDRMGGSRGGDRSGDRPSDRDRDRGMGSDRKGSDRGKGDRRDGRGPPPSGDRGYPPPRDGPRGGHSDRGPGGPGGRSTNAVPPPSFLGGAPPPSGGMPPLHISGCSNETVSQLIQGEYFTKESNHGKPVYRKEGPPGSVTVLIYYWDERDGAAFNGWWFGPKVGGDQVWAYNGANLGRENVMPPMSNWKVPWDGKVDDKLKITQVSHRSGGPGSFSGHGPDPRMSREEEDRRRRDAERDRQRQVDDKRRREEEDRRRDEERRRRMREEEQAREAAMRRKREEERRQEAAANNVRKVLDRLRVSTPETFSELQAELDRAAAQNFQAMGSLRDKVNDEMQNTLTQAQKRIAEEIKQREEADRRRQVEIARVQLLVREAKDEIDVAEAKVAEAQASSKAACTSGTDPAVTPDYILKAVAEAASELAAAKEGLEKGEKALATRKEQMGNGDGGRACKRDVEELEGRLSGSHRALVRSTENLEEARNRGKRRKSALHHEEACKASFRKFCGDGDAGRMSRAEVAAFASEDFKFPLPEDVLNKIMRVLEPISFDKFAALRQKIGIAKSEADARTKRSQEEEQKRLVQEKRQELQKGIDEITAKVEEGKSKVAQAEETLKATSKEADVTAETVSAGISKAEGLVQEVKDISALTSKFLEEVEATCVDLPELKRLVRSDVEWIQFQIKKIEAHLQKVTGMATEAQNLASQKVQDEVCKLRVRVVAALRSAMAAQAKSGEALFDEISSGKAINCESFTNYLKSLEGLQEALSDQAQAARLFEDIAGSAESELDKEAFQQLIRLFYKCVKSTVLSDDISIKSKTVRRLELNEVLEVLEGPSKEDGANVQRIRCSAVQDGAMGWATIAGNQGTPFLVQGGNVLSCVKEVPITSSLEEGTAEVRKLAAGEIFEVQEFQRKEAAAEGEKATRYARGKAKSDAATGWVAVLDKEGNANFEVS